MKIWITTFVVIAMLSGAIPVRGITNSCIDITTDAYGNLFLLNPETQKVFKFDDNLNFIEESMNSISLKMANVDSFTVCWCAGELSFSSLADGKTQMYEIDENWDYVYHRNLADVGNGKGQVKIPSDIKYLRSEEDYWVAITDKSQGKVVIIDDFGEFHHEIVGLKSPVSTYYSPKKILYVIDDGQIKVFSPTGKLQNSFGKDILNNPTAIDASKHDDKFYVLDGSKIVVFSATGKKINSFGSFKSAVDVTVNTFKNWVIVASCENGGTLQAFDYEGRLVKTVTSAGSPVRQTVLRFKVDSYVYHINGEGTKLRCPVRIENDRSLVPIREIVEPLGGVITWDGSTKTIMIKIESSTIILRINQSIAIVDGQIKQLPSSVPPRIYCEGVTMVPLRFVSEILGAEVEYFASDKTIEVKK
ncbi:MAG: hypothetical protein KAH30_01590 [Caldisericia bacterium]|nr:hypothetical protein [Caldisericia bacterium]